MLMKHLLPWAKYVKRSLLAAPLPGEKDDRPYCVYDESEAVLFYAQDKTTRDAWNEYCQMEIAAFNERGSYDRQAHLYYQWKPSLDFPAWLARRVI